MDDRDARWCHRDGSGSARLLAVPVFAWTAYRDIETRRVSSTVLDPLALLGAVLLGWDGWLAWSAGGDAWTFEFLIPTAISLGLVVPIAYLFWWFGGFGGADAKALLVLAVLFPTFPKYALGSWTFPTAGTTDIGTFSFTILTNAVLVGDRAPDRAKRSETPPRDESRRSCSSVGPSPGSGFRRPTAACSRHRRGSLEAASTSTRSGCTSAGGDSRLPTCAMTRSGTATRRRYPPNRIRRPTAR